MRRLLISCTKCRRNLWVDFEGDVRALQPLVHQKQSEHRTEELCPGELVTAVIERNPALRLDPEPTGATRFPALENYRDLLKGKITFEEYSKTGAGERHG